jgi:carbonic anhydrase/acetyltransferase-like protein (isoleucine patch superfamily)
MILSYKDVHPETEPAAYIAPSADVIGDVKLGEDSSIWFNVSVRGDMSSITIGERTNIQDNAVVHVNTGMPTVIGNDVTVGHGAIIHACTIGNHCLIGMGAIVLDEAVIPEYSLVAAGALVPPGKTYPPRNLLMGSPAKAIRELTEAELKHIRENAAYYVEEARSYSLLVN